jgi:L-methionine (R)-S-oxide reductase
MVVPASRLERFVLPGYADRRGKEASMIDPGRSGAYERLYLQLEPLIRGKSPNLVAGMATAAALLHAKLRHHSWTGFYFVAGPDELHVGPYQGAVACQVLKGRGVCLRAVTTASAVVVPDVGAFPGHIACDSRSKSEIVIPLKKDGRVVAVLDVDSDKLAQFDDDDVEPLSRIVSLLESLPGFSAAP